MLFISDPKISIAGMLLWLGAVIAAADERPDPARFEADIAAFEKAEAGETEVLFLGSSSIRLWDTKKSFPDLASANRGFGGSWIQDSLHYAERIIAPLAPTVVVLYAGDNDVSGNLSADEVYEDYVKFAGWLRDRLPEARLVFIAIKPSIQRWNLWPTMKEVNMRIRERCRSEAKEYFADIAPATLGEDGKPREDLFQDDGLHLNQKGYEAWTRVLGPVIARALQEEN